MGCIMGSFSFYASFLENNWQLVKYTNCYYHFRDGGYLGVGMGGVGEWVGVSGWGRGYPIFKRNPSKIYLEHTEK